MGDRRRAGILAAFPFRRPAGEHQAQDQSSQGGEESHLISAFKTGNILATGLLEQSSSISWRSWALVLTARLADRIAQPDGVRTGSALQCQRGRSTSTGFTQCRSGPTRRAIELIL